MDTRQHIIYLADELIRRKGFNAFSYMDIAETLEIRKAAIHYYFPVKADLGKAVVDEEIQRINRYRQERAPGSGDEQLKFLVSSFYESSRLRLICLMGSLMPDFETFEVTMQAKVEQMCTVILEWVSECLEEARGKGLLHFEGGTADRAKLVISTLLSSLLLSRVLGAEVFQQMLDQLLRDMGLNWRIRDLTEKI